MTQQLSPVAQAVQFAAFRVYDEEEHLYVVPAEKHAGLVAAAAIRAAAKPFHWTWNAEMCHKHLIAIASELEAQ